MNICPQALTWNILMPPSGEVECISTPTDFELGYVILLCSSMWEEVVVYQFWAEAFNNITYISLILLNSCTQPEYQKEMCIKQTCTQCRCWRQAQLNLAEKSHRQPSYRTKICVSEPLRFWGHLLKKKRLLNTAVSNSTSYRTSK